MEKYLQRMNNTRITLGVHMITSSMVGRRKSVKAEFSPTPRTVKYDGDWKNLEDIKLLIRMLIN